MRLHGAVGKLAPERAQRLQLLTARCGRKSWRDRIGQTALAVPALQKPTTIVVCRLNRVPQPLRRVPVHAGFAANSAEPACLGLGKEGVDTLGVYGAETRHRGRAMAKRQIEEPRRNLGGIVRIAELHFLGKRIGVQPVDQPLAPTGDDAGLRIVHVGIDKARQDQGIAVVGDRRLGMRTAERPGIRHRFDHAPANQNTAVCMMRRRHRQPF